MGGALPVAGGAEVGGLSTAEDTDVRPVFSARLHVPGPVAVTALAEKVGRRRRWRGDCGFLRPSDAAGVGISRERLALVLVAIGAERGSLGFRGGHRRRGLRRLGRRRRSRCRLRGRRKAEESGEDQRGDGSDHLQSRRHRIPPSKRRIRGRSSNRPGCAGHATGRGPSRRPSPFRRRGTSRTPRWDSKLPGRSRCSGRRAPRRRRCHGNRGTRPCPVPAARSSHAA